MGSESAGSALNPTILIVENEEATAEASVGVVAQNASVEVQEADSD